jgi:CheY-like chemotaxis protein
MIPPSKESEPFVVVIVEDEIIIRMAAADVLTDEGFSVLEAGSADEALAILRSRASTVSLLFSDIHMPGQMNGLALAHQVHGLWPWVGILLASGQVRPGQREMPCGSRFIAKPYDLSHVVAHCRNLAAVR